MDRPTQFEFTVGAHQQYWEKFDGALEEMQASTILDACAMAGCRWVIFTTYEDAALLRRKSIKSQIVPRPDGTLAEPTFPGLRTVKDRANQKAIRVTHMITSYLKVVSLACLATASFEDKR